MMPHFANVATNTISPDTGLGVLGVGLTTARRLWGVHAHSARVEGGRNADYGT